MNSILETESLPFFDGFDLFTSIDDGFGKVHNTDYNSISFLKSPDEQLTNILGIDLNNIFDSSSESEGNSPQTILLENELISKNFDPVNSDELNFIPNNESINYNLDHLEDNISSSDTILNFEINNINEKEQDHTMINLDNLDELSSESESFKDEDIILTEEEKNIYLKEGYNIPTRKPLTKSEEKILKMVRRKIRNKKSAHISRERKKNYIDGLEKRVDLCTKENEELQREVKCLKTKNFQLMKELQKMQSLVTTLFTKNKKSSTAVLLVSFLITFCIFPQLDIAEEEINALRGQESFKSMNENTISTNKQISSDEINRMDRNKYIWEIYKTRYDI